MNNPNLCIFNKDCITINISEDIYFAFSNLHHEIEKRALNKITPYDAWKNCTYYCGTIPDGYEEDYEIIDNFITELNSDINNYLKDPEILKMFKNKHNLLVEAIKFVNISILGVENYRKFY